MITNIKIPLSEDEYVALSRIAVKEERNPANQVRFLIRKELARRNMLPTSPAPQETRREQP